MADLIPRTATPKKEYNPYGFQYQGDWLPEQQMPSMIAAGVKPRALTQPLSVVPKTSTAYKGGTQGNYETQGSSGTFKTDPLTGGQIAQMATKPAMDVANVLVQKRMIEKQHARQMGRTIAPYQTPHVTIQSAQDLPAEVLQQYERAAAQVRSQYAGSDPTMDLVSKQMAEAKRADIRERAAAARGQNLVEERRRVAKEKQEQQLRAADVANRNVDRQQELADYKLSADINRMTQLRKLSANVLTDLSKNIDTRAIYNTQKNLVQRQNKLASTSSTLAYKIREKERLEAQGYDTTDIDQEIENLAAVRDAEATRPLPGYDESRKNWLSFKRGGKLVPR